MNYSELPLPSVTLLNPKKRTNAGARSRPSVLLVALVSALSLTACGGGSEVDTADQAGATASGLERSGSQEGATSEQVVGTSADLERAGSEEISTLEQVVATTTDMARGKAASSSGTQIINGATFKSVACATENKVCNYSGRQTVAYGAAGKFTIKQLTGPVSCSNGIFGDPIRLVVKSCFLSATAAPAPAPAPAAGTSQSVVAQLEATRVSGTAPLAVQFDATATTSTLASQHPFHQVRYSFNFGDDRGQTWPISGLPKNSQTGGPLSAHVFDQPGNYQVRVRATDQTGGYSERTVSVQVLDPNAVYSGTGTICVSAAANFAGCPTGASQMTVMPSSASFNGRRVLLKRGETFGSIDIPHGSQNVQVGAFGTGAKPRVSSVLVGAMGPTSSAFPRDISIMDLNILQRVEQFVTMSRLFLYRNTFEVPTGEFVAAQINIASALAYIVQHHTLAPNQYIQPREIFVVENQLRGSTSNPHVNMMGEGSRFVIMGNDMGTATQHTIRLYAMHKGFIAHNALRGRSSDGIRVALKLHSGGLGDYNDNYAISGGTWASRQVVIANNRLGDATDNNSFTGGASPENNGTESRQGLEDVVLENNVFHRGPNTNTEFILMGRRMTSRGNTRADGGAPNINQYNNSYQLLPADWVGPFYYQ